MMQAVVFYVGEERFAIDTKSVAEVIPCIDARPVPATMEAIRGVIEYRGSVIPVLDLCLLFGRGACPMRLSNRILVCNVPGSQEAPDGAAPADGTGTRYIGVQAENVTRVTTLDPDAPGTHPGPETPGIGGLGKILKDETGLVQLVNVAELVPPEVLDALAREPDA